MRPGDDFESLFPVALLIVTEAVSLACALHLWRRPDGSVLKRVLWSAVLPIPIFGPLLYGGRYGGLSTPDPTGSEPEPIDD